MKKIKNEFGTFYIGKKRNIGFGGVGNVVYQEIQVRNVRTGKVRTILAGLGFITNQIKLNDLMRYRIKKGDIENFKSGKCEVIEVY